MVASGADNSCMERILDGIPKVSHPREALVAESFAGVFDSSDATGHPEGKHGRYAIRNTLPPPGIIEHWRQVVVDVTQPDAGRGLRYCRPTAFF